MRAETAVFASHPPAALLRTAPVAPKPASIRVFPTFYQIGSSLGKRKSGLKPVRLIRKRCADFHHGPECNAALQQKAEYMTATGSKQSEAATLRTGLGPYMSVRD